MEKFLTEEESLQIGLQVKRLRQIALTQIDNHLTPALQVTREEVVALGYQILSSLNVWHEVMTKGKKVIHEI